MAQQSRKRLKVARTRSVTSDSEKPCNTIQPAHKVSVGEVVNSDWQRLGDGRAASRQLKSWSNLHGGQSWSISQPYKVSLRGHFNANCVQASRKQDLTDLALMRIVRGNRRVLRLIVGIFCCLMRIFSLSRLARTVSTRRRTLVRLRWSSSCVCSS